MITQNHIWLMGIGQDITDPKSPRPVDIFNIKGDFVGAATLVPTPFFISDRYVYFVVEDMDELFLQRYDWQLKNQ